MLAALNIVRKEAFAAGLLGRWHPHDFLDSVKNIANDQVSSYCLGLGLGCASSPDVCRCRTCVLKPSEEHVRALTGCQAPAYDLDAVGLEGFIGAEWPKEEVLEPGVGVFDPDAEKEAAQISGQTYSMHSEF